jgi:hypothetical protein
LKRKEFFHYDQDHDEEPGYALRCLRPAYHREPGPVIQTLSRICPGAGLRASKTEKEIYKAMKKLIKNINAHFAAYGEHISRWNGQM